MGGTIIESSLPAGDDDFDEAYAPDPIIEEEPEPSAADRAEQARLAVVEAEARRSGWVPLAEFRGPPGTWRSAEDFVARGNSIAPILRKQLRDTEAKLDRTNSEMAGLRETVQTQSQQIAQLLENSKRAEKVGYDRAIAELKGRQREAVAEGAAVEVMEIGEQISRLEEERAAATVQPAKEPEKKPLPQPEPKALHPDVQDFVDNNEWFMKDRALHAAMQAEHAEIQEKVPGLSMADSLQRAKEIVMSRYPDKFGITPAPRKPNRNNVTPPNGAGPGAERPAGPARTIAAIQDPAEREAVRKAFASAKGNMPDLTESVYLQVMEDPKIDVLELLREERQKKQQPPAARRA